MKKNQNIKVRSMSKAFALATLLAIVGCKQQTEHYTNVVIDVTITDTKGWILMRDVETGKERVYVRELDPQWESLSEDIKSLQKGDTIVFSVTSDKLSRHFATPYEARKVVHGHYGDIKDINMDSKIYEKELGKMKAAQQHGLRQKTK